MSNMTERAGRDAASKPAAKSIVSEAAFMHMIKYACC